ncbi:MAG: glycoside hydrolase family 127 protein, partial [Ktedonobacteraceae bacterium]|nr:glycoside hydrolase family 127 protein [Ktedonobacteraceae bacterium]
MVQENRQPQPPPVASRTTHAPVINTAHSRQARLCPVGPAGVRLKDDFWAPRRDINRLVTLPSQYEQCEATGRLDNFRRAAGRYSGPFQGFFFNDSDVYKWLEAAAWTQATDPSPELAKLLDEVARLVVAAQDEDGYLNTYFTFERKAERWTNLKDMHELYCAGHFIQAAVAHHRATGESLLLDVAIRLANHIASVFGPAARRGACGHPEIEMALVELARETDEQRYVALAQFFVDQRGQQDQQPPLFGGHPYYQDHAPFRQQQSVAGHAVRALYLYAGATDIYLETGEEALKNAVDALWQDLYAHQVYITGGVGSRYEGEAFGEAYELPDRRAYSETCAAIASVLWNLRLLQFQG